MIPSECEYQRFLNRKSQITGGYGFDPIFLPDKMFDFQKHLVAWSLRQGRSAILADCGLGKTFMQLVWAENVARHANGRVLVLTPLAVSRQTENEAQRFDIEATRSQDGKLKSRIVITNYDRLEHFDPVDFIGVVCDESSIIKNVSGQTRKQITRFMSKLPYRLLCTATAAPNDYVELGTSSEALGELNHSEMLRRFFKMLDDKGQKSETKKQDEAERIIRNDPSYFQKLSYRVAQTIGQWRLKHHAVTPFWRWVASWARACRTPSDLGFSDDGFILPPLVERDHIVKAPPADGYLFTVPAKGLAGERDERKRTINERCRFAADLVNHTRQAVIWCHTNDEGKLLNEIIPDAEEVAGCTSIQQREELYDAFSAGDLRVLVIKHKIGAWGMNWMHCNHSVSFATHSWEQHYQSMRRFYRFGQKQAVTADTIATDGEIRVMDNMRRKSEKARLMFEMIVKEMQQATRVTRPDIYTNKIEVPSWLSASK
jgi:hypothetical protein